jgi:radical SAM superfamily enzyme YgiQ (UPF0313 family)
MHTAMRLAMRAAAGIRRARPALALCFYGLYAPVSRDLTVGAPADRVIAGEYEPALVRWVAELEAGIPTGGAGESLIQLGRHEFELPARDLPLERYAHLALGGEEPLVGCVEASHGCVHRCRHCPVPPVYDGAHPDRQRRHHAEGHRAPCRAGRPPHHVRRSRRGRRPGHRAAA